MEKDFTNWTTLKAHLNHAVTPPQFNQGDVWWCSVGRNIGYEQDGMTDIFARPVLIVRKFSPRTFVGIPLTTKLRHHPYSTIIRFKGREQCLLLSQLRLWDAKRLSNRMGRLPTDKFSDVKRKLANLLEL